MVKKIIYSLLFSILLCHSLIAQQVPQGMSYQAIARDGKGNLLTNSQIDIVFTIIDGSINGSTLYKEQQLTTSNNQGLFTLIIGKGKPLQNTFEKIPWSNNGAKFLKIELGIASSSQLTLLGTTQLLSVPYALMAQKAIQKPDSMSINDLIDVKTGGTKPNEVLTFDGKNWVNKPQNTLSYKSGAGITIKNDTISAIDNSTTNEIQSLSQKGDTISLSKNGGSVITKSKKYFAGQGIVLKQDTIQNIGDLSNTNEIQTLSISNSTISLSKGGGSVTVPSTSNNYNAGSGIVINNNSISANDNSPTNEIQQLSISGNTLSISDGNSVQLPNSGGGGGSFDPLGPTLLHPQGLRGTVIQIPINGTYQLPAGKNAYSAFSGQEIGEYSLFKGPTSISPVTNAGSLHSFVIFDSTPNIEIIKGSFSQYTVPSGKYFIGSILPGVYSFASEGQVFTTQGLPNWTSVIVNGYLINK